MHRRRFVGALAGIAGALLLMVPAHRAAAGPVVVTKAVWTSSIDRASHEHGPTFRQSAPPAKLYLWTLLEGNERALADLRAAGRLPLKHVWLTSFAGRGVPVDVATPEDQFSPVDEVPLTMGPKPEAKSRDEVLSGLQREIRELGYFDWRTWSSKSHLTPGRWRVQIFDGRGDPVLCRTDAGEHECQLEIHIRKRSARTSS